MSDDQFSQLQTQMTDFGSQMTTMQTQISDLGSKIGGLETQMDGFDVSLERMYAHMEKRFDHLEETKVDKTDFNRIYDQLDGLIKRIDEDRAERLATISQLNRHDGWHHQTARHLGLTLS